MGTVTSVVYADKVLKCDHCGGEEFSVSKITLTSSLFGEFVPALFSPQVPVYGCIKCSKQHWFGTAPQSIITKTYCVRCGAKMTDDEISCQVCGTELG
jgi:DNA-directed RNA polymerase subunit RPC12/RpoP